VSPVAAPTLYEVLGVAQDVDDLELKRAFRRKARQLHPDVAGPESGPAFAAVTEAYDRLKDPYERLEYDRELRLAAEGGSGPDPETWAAPEPGPEPAWAPPPAPEPERPTGPEPAPAPVRPAPPSRLSWRVRGATAGVALVPAVALLLAHHPGAWAWAVVAAVLSVAMWRTGARSVRVLAALVVAVIGVWVAHPAGVLALVASSSVLIWPAAAGFLTTRKG